MTTIVNQKLEKREKMIDIFVGSKTDDKGNEETDDKKMIKQVIQQMIKQMMNNQTLPICRI